MSNTQDIEEVWSTPPAREEKDKEESRKGNTKKPESAKPKPKASGVKNR